MRKQLPALLLALTLAVTLLVGIIWTLGTTPSIMLSLMQKHAPSESTYLPEEEYPAMAEMITGYLSGRVEAFQHVFTIDGTDYLAFRSHEQQHMADCRELFALASEVAANQTALGLKTKVNLIPEAEKKTPPSFNLTTALHHVCGAVSSTYESNEGLVDKNAFTAEEILLHHYCLFKGMFEHKW